MNVTAHPTLHHERDFASCSCTGQCGGCDTLTVVPSRVRIDAEVAASLLCEACQRHGCRRGSARDETALRGTKPDPDRVRHLIETSRRSKGLTLVPDGRGASRAAADDREREIDLRARRAELWFGAIDPRHRRKIGRYPLPESIRPEIHALGSALKGLKTGGSPANLVLSGKPGTGKTTLAITAATGAVLSGAVAPSQAAFIRVADLLTTATRGMPSERAPEVNAAIAGKRLVILDDLGRIGDAPKDAAKSVLNAILDDLYRREVAILATTNLSDRDLREHLEAASYGRLIEDTPNRCVTVLDGEDRRLS